MFHAKFVALLCLCNNLEAGLAKMPTRVWQLEH